jgi:hypothetical protein
MNYEVRPVINKTRYTSYGISLKTLFSAACVSCFPKNKTHHITSVQP